MTKTSRQSVIAALAIVYIAYAGAVDQPTSSPDDPNRFVFDESALAISRPDESWEFEVDANDPETVAEMRSPDGAAVADIQLRELPGVILEQLKQPIEQAMAEAGRDFNKLSSRDVDVHGVGAYELTVELTREGERHRAKLLVVKPGDTLYMVKCRSSVDAWPRFESACHAVLASFEILPRKPWGRRIEWDVEIGPEAREHASFVLDAGRDRAVMLLGSGYQPYLDPLGDAWAYDLNNDRWSKLQLEGDPIAPGGSRRAARVNDGAFVHGGYGTDLAESGELWKLEFEAGGIKVRRIEQDHAPEARSLHAFAADNKGERFVVFGGGTTKAVLGDTWIGRKQGKNVSWRKLDLDVNPGPRFGFAFAHDDERGLLIVCGGQVPSGKGSEEFALDTWALDFTTEEPEWTLLARYESREFPGRRNPAFAFDRRSGKLFVWGGAGADDRVIPDLFIVATREDGAPVQRVAQAALIPTRASGFGIVDPKRSRLLMGFGNVAAGAFPDLVEIELGP